MIIRYAQAHKVLETFRVSSFLFPDCRKMHQRFYCLEHIVHANPFELAVDVLHTGENIRTRQAHITQPAAVGAAPDRVLSNGKARTHNGFFCICRYLRVFEQYFFHIAVLLLLAMYSIDVPFITGNNIRCNFFQPCMMRYQSNR
jgi:hypothetical protein